MTRVQVVVPFRGGCPHRERAWQWIRERYASTHPGWEVVEAPAPDGPWCKGAAVGPAIEASEAAVVVVADADVWCDGLGQAVAEVAAGVPWAVPHRKVRRLSETATGRVLAGADIAEQNDLVQSPYTGLLGGGIVVAPREVLQAVPIDSRFRSWGQEDEAHAIALNALVGKPWRGTVPLYHLFHPPQERMTRRRGSAESWRLRSRYMAARNRPDAMRELLEEARCL